MPSPGPRTPVEAALQAVRRWAAAAVAAVSRFRAEPDSPAADPGESGGTSWEELVRRHAPQLLEPGPGRLAGDRHVDGEWSGPSPVELGTSPAVEPRYPSATRAAHPETGAVTWRHPAAGAPEHGEADVAPTWPLSGRAPRTPRADDPAPVTDPAPEWSAPPSRRGPHSRREVWEPSRRVLIRIGPLAVVWTRRPGAHPPPAEQQPGGAPAQGRRGAGGSPGPSQGEVGAAEAGAAARLTDDHPVGRSRAHHDQPSSAAPPPGPPGDPGPVAPADRTVASFGGPLDAVTRRAQRARSGEPDVGAPAPEMRWRPPSPAGRIDWSAVRSSSGSRSAAGSARDEHSGGRGDDEGSTGRDRVTGTWDGDAAGDPWTTVRDQLEPPMPVAGQPDDRWPDLLPPSPVAPVPVDRIRVERLAAEQRAT